MPEPDPEELYRRAQAANKRHEREFKRYLDLLLDRGPSSKKVIEQLAKADEAVEQASAAQQAFDQATAEE